MIGGLDEVSNAFEGRASKTPDINSSNLTKAIFMKIIQLAI